MNRVWSLYRGRILLVLALAVLSGFGFTCFAWADAHPHDAMGAVLLHGLMYSPAVALPLFLFCAAFTIPGGIRAGSRSGGSGGSDSLSEYEEQRQRRETDSLAFYGNPFDGPGPRDFRSGGDGGIGGSNGML